MKFRAEDKWFSLYIRARDGWQCQRCGKRYIPHREGGDNRHLGGLHSAHMFSRGAKKTKWDERNVMALCNGCHRYVDKHYEVKETLFASKVGQDTVDELRLLSHQPFIGWKNERANIAKSYRERFRAINKQYD